MAEVKQAYKVDPALAEPASVQVAEPRVSYDLEERTYRYARRVIALSRRLPHDLANREVLRQLVRAAGSVGANYIEANEGLSRKDFRMRIKICRKEAKESRYWLRLLRVPTEKEAQEQSALIQEATELTLIFGAILQKTK